MKSRSLDVFAMGATLAALGMQFLYSPGWFGFEAVGPMGNTIFWVLGGFAIVVCGLRFWVELPQIFYHPTRNSFVALALTCLLILAMNTPGFWAHTTEALLWAAWVSALSLWIPVIESKALQKVTQMWRQRREEFGLPETEVVDPPLQPRGVLYVFLGAGVASFIFWAAREEDWRAGMETAAIFFTLCIPFSSRHSLPLIRLGTQIRALKREIWIRRPESIDRMEEITSVAFDKTGSLTDGQPRLTKKFSVENISQKEVLQLAASLEAGLEHPYAKAILAEAEAESVKLLEAKDRHFEPGKGVKAKIAKDGKEHEVVIGNLVWLFENGLNSSDVPDELTWNADGLEDTIVWVMKDAQALGLLVLHDVYRADAKESVQELIDLGYDVGLITGDTENVGKRVGKDLQLKFSHAGVMPVEKATVIRRLSEKKKKALDVIFPKVLFVANASQDIPALQEAHLSWGLCPKDDWLKHNFHLLSEPGSVKKILSGAKVLQEALQLRTHNSLIEMLYHVVALSWAAGLLTFFSWTWRGNPAIAAFLALVLGIILTMNSLRRIHN